MTGSMIECTGVEAVKDALDLLSNVINGTDCLAMSDGDLAKYRKEMSKVQSKAQEGLSRTGRKELNFDEKEISDYIDLVLQRGFELVATNPGDVPKLKDAQGIKRFRELIKKCVQASVFGENQFKIAALSVQRKNIENSATLHELRQNIKAMIPVLNLYREHEALRADYKKIMDYTDEWVSVQEYDQVLLELELVQELSDEYKRVIYGLTDGLYQPIDKLSGEELLQAIDAFKLIHQCNDDEAAKFYGTNRTKISRLRREANRQLH